MQNDGIGFADYLKSCPKGIPQFCILNFVFYLETRIDVGCNVPNVILQLAVAGFQGCFDLADVIQRRGVVLGKLLADVR